MPWKNTDPVDAANLNTKSGHVFDVRDAEFGAVGDGKTEDHAAFSSPLTLPEDTVAES